MKDINKTFQEQFLEASSDIHLATRFWNRHNPKPFDLLNNFQYYQLRERLFALLQECRKIDSAAFDRIHKGHPYYFIGIASYLLDDFQTAIYFFDAAVTEDMNSGAHPITDPRPSTRFLMLEGAEIRQGAKVITELTEAKIDRILTHYNTQITKHASIPQLTKDALRIDFIVPCLTNVSNPGLRTLVTALITYCIEWDFRNQHFDYGVKSGTSEPFFSHLFRGCLLFESLLLHNRMHRPTGKNLGAILNESIIRQELNTRPIIGKGGDILHDVFVELNTYNNTIDEAIKITYMTRNTLGHNLGWDTCITQEQYQNLYLITASSCLHVIACLWK